LIVFAAQPPLAAAAAVDLMHGQLDAVPCCPVCPCTRAWARPRGAEHQEALRLRLLARRTAVETRKVALLQLRSVIVTAPAELREELRRLPLGRLLNRCRFRRSGSRTPAQLATILVLRTVSIPRSLYASIPRC
jgi:transposase